jgi:hypothetical protein
MSEYKIGDKVYLECEISDRDLSDNTYGVNYYDYYKVARTAYWVKSEQLHPTDESYNKGLNDAWELAGKILIDSDDGGYTIKELEKIFGTVFPGAVFADLTPQEALAKVKEYEERNEIKKGDVVKLKCGSAKGIVTRVTETNICCLFKDGSCDSLSAKEDFEKTGEHFDSIDEFMRSADD